MRITNFQFLISNSKFQKGQLLVELLVAIGIAALIFPGLVAGIMATRDGRAQQRQRLEALTYMKEAYEAVRSVREKGWSNLYATGTYYPHLLPNGSWELATGSATINGFTTSITMGQVYRLNGAIVLPPTVGTLDNSTRQAVIIVSWNQPFASSVQSTLYLTRYLENDSYVETTQTQFNAGVLTGTTVRATNPPAVSNDGEVILGSGGNSDWCQPNLLSSGSATLDLPGSGYASSITAIEGKAFGGTGENASGLSFMGMNISNTHPPVPNLGSTFDGYKTNDVFGETNYGYISTDTNSKEVVIINISGSTYNESGYFNAPGNGSGTGIFVLNNIGYVISGSTLYNFDLSSKTGSRPGLDLNGVTLTGTGARMYGVGNYIYVTSNSSTRELQIIDVSNSSNLTVVGWADLPGSAGKDVFVDSSGNRAYVATATNSSQREMFIVNVSTKTGSRPMVGSYDTSGMDPKGITVVPGNRAIIVGSGGIEYQVIDISNESNPTSCGQEDVVDSNGNAIAIHDVASVLETDGDAYSYIVTADANKEFKIIEGGPGGSYASNGEFESQTFNPGYETANNRFSATFSYPANTTIKFQVSIAKTVNGSCPSTGGYTYVGPDPTNPSVGSSAYYFTPASGESVAFPLTGPSGYANPGQCFRYKVFMTSSNQNSTPVLNDFTINYSP